MLRTFLWLVGPPGVGKTTLARKLLDPDPYLVVSPKWTVSERVAAAGHYSMQPFDGADTVPYAGAKACLDYWEEHLAKHALTMFDGDRFSNAKVLDWGRERGQVRIVHLTALGEVLDERRKERGSEQSASWMKGRATKSERFAAMVQEDERLLLDAGHLSTESMEQKLRDWLGLR